jgi:hypothetical protein
MWEIDLDGDQADIAELKMLAPLCDCIISPGRDGRECLSGNGFDALSAPEEVRAQAAKILTLLNGIARMTWGQFRPVQLGTAVSRNHPDGTRDVAIGLIGAAARSRAAPLGMGETQRAKRIIADPKVHEIANALADDLTWQRLRVAFEKVCALVSGRAAKGSWDNAIVANGYATQDEISRFKANAEDPRISGFDAVHGVPQGPPKGKKMSEQEGLEFVVQLLNTYLDRQP